MPLARPPRFVALLLILVVAPWMSSQIAHAAAADRPAKPNVVVILADDLGRGDCSAFGTKDIRTPNIDRLFREGMTFDNFYANSCVCSPTRAALLTGCYPDRVGVPGVIRDIRENSWGYLAPQAVLLSSLLHTAGYHCGIVGKWHLGDDPPNTPTDRGFDLFRGFLGDMMDDYWTHLRNGKNFMRRDREVITPEGHATDLFTAWASEYLEERARARQPFFLYLPYNAPHGPIQPPAEWLERVRQREPRMSGPRAALVALIEHMDAGIGQVLETLDKTGLAKNTLIVFTSDNGGVIDGGANNGPWRSGKTHMYEGGLRVLCAARWPGQIAEGSRTERFGLSMDWFPTVLEAAGVQPPVGIDGVSLLPALRGQKMETLGRDLYFVRREGGAAYGGKTIEAVRHGDWKLVQDSPFGPAELFNLARDPHETTDLARSERKRYLELLGILQKQIQRAGSVPWQASP